MTGSRKVLLAIVALAVPVYFLPATRDELSWCWAQSNEHSDCYLRYLSDWPHGRHVVEARLFYAERRRAEATMEQIRAASSTNSDAEAVYRLEREARRDNFSWKKASSHNTMASYREYLRQYPAGRHAAEARRKIQALGPPAANINEAPR